jgi:hypothetical protein
MTNTMTPSEIAYWLGHEAEFTHISEGLKYAQAAATIREREAERNELRLAYKAIYDRQDLTESKLKIATEALEEARGEIIGMVNSRWSEFEGSEDEYVRFIDQALARIKEVG